MYRPYDVYRLYKTVESDVKNKKLNILTEDKWDSKMSLKNKEILITIAGMFNTKYSNVDLTKYIECGFKHFKTFNYDKFFREIVLREYISRDSREKRKSSESVENVTASLKYINRPIETYLTEVNGSQKQILQDYLDNKIGPTVIVWCIWRHLYKPTSVEWEYMNTISNNWEDFKNNMIPHRQLLDAWRTNMKRMTNE